MPSVLERVDGHRHQMHTRSGPVSYLDTGGPGRPALFVHGVGTSSLLWRNVIDQIGGEHRCVAIDLPLHGQTPAPPDQDFSLPALADFVAGCCDALELTNIDLVANDTGGAVAQVFAARNPGRLASLTLTNCETHDNVHPLPLLPGLLLARLGLLAPLMRRLLRDIPRARKRFYAGGYQDVGQLPEDVVRAWVEPVTSSAQGARQFQRLARSVHARDLLAVEPALARLQVPTLIVWGTGDMFFKRKWAYWLRDTIPGATEVIEFDGARLFFPDERATEFTAALRRHWAAAGSGQPGTGVQ